MAQKKAVYDNQKEAARNGTLEALLIVFAIIGACLYFLSSLGWLPDTLQMTAVIKGTLTQMP